MLDISRMEIGNFLEIKLSTTKEHKGLWKIIEVQKIHDGEEYFYRMKLDKNESKVGDEIWAEYYPSMPKKLCIFTEFDTFTKENAQGWPPPPAITIEDIEYFSLDTEATEDSHDGFEGTFADTSTYTHWEYEDESTVELLQITLIDDYVTMYKGYTLNTGFVVLT